MKTLILSILILGMAAVARTDDDLYWGKLVISTRTVIASSIPVVDGWHCVEFGTMTWTATGILSPCIRQEGYRDDGVVVWRKHPTNSAQELKDAEERNRRSNPYK